MTSIFFYIQEVFRTF